MMRNCCSVVFLLSVLSLVTGSCASEQSASRGPAAQEASSRIGIDSTDFRFTAIDSTNINSADAGSIDTDAGSIGDGLLSQSDSSFTIDSERSRLPHTKVIGYYAWWTRGAWIDLDLSQYDKLIFFTTTPGADGNIESRNGWPHAWISLLDRADSLGIPVVPTLALLDPDAIRNLFMSESARANLLSTALTLIEESRGAGLHLDIELFEPASDSLQNLFMTFTDSLATLSARRFPEAELSMFVPALQDNSLYDLSRINKFYGEIMVQGYDLHWQTGPIAGPLSPLHGWEGVNWHRIAKTYEDAGIDRNRMIMTIPYYGYEWPVETPELGSKTRGDGRIVTLARVDSLNLPDIQVTVSDRIERHGLQRDEASGSPYYSFEDSTGWWQGWFEDRSSLEHKYDFVRDRDMRGVAIFPIGYDAGSLDEIIISKFGYRRR